MLTHWPTVEGKASISLKLQSSSSRFVSLMKKKADLEHVGQSQYIPYIPCETSLISCERNTPVIYECTSTNVVSKAPKALNPTLSTMLLNSIFFSPIRHFLPGKHTSFKTPHSQFFTQAFRYKFLISKIVFHQALESSLQSHIRHYTTVFTGCGALVIYSTLILNSGKH